MAQTLVKTRAPHTGATMSKRVCSSRENAERNVKIIEKWETGRFSQKKLGAEFGLTQGAISQIVNNPNACDYWE